MQYKASFWSILIFALFLSQHSISQVQGKWEGEISLMSQDIQIEFDFDKKEKGIMNIPNQGAYGLDVNVKKSDSSGIQLVVDSTRRPMRFTGNQVHSDSIFGTFRQSGHIGRFMLSRVKEEKHPWVDREVTFQNDTINLAGTLSLPDTTGEHPAVVFISGSGQQDRDENVKGFKVFKTLATSFINSGIAVLRYDDRGTGDSDNGNFRQADSRDFAEDAAAAFKFLASHPHIKKGEIGMLGHSEGGIIASMVAQNHNLDFIIMMAGTTLPGDKILQSQTRALLKANNLDSATIQSRVDFNTTIYEELKKDEPNREKIYKLFYDFMQEQRPGTDSSTIASTVNMQVDAINRPWFRFFLQYDPKPALEKLEIPVLAVFGGKDLQVTDTLNREPIDNLIDSGKDNFTVKVFPEANHLFQDAQTGNISEYGRLPKKFVKGFEEYLIQWTQQALEKKD